MHYHYFLGQVITSPDEGSLKHFGIEIRTALNYQTECIRRELSNLTSVSNLFSGKQSIIE